MPTLCTYNWLQKSSIVTKTLLWVALNFLHGKEGISEASDIYKSHNIPSRSFLHNNHLWSRWGMQTNTDFANQITRGVKTASPGANGSFQSLSFTLISMNGLIIILPITSCILKCHKIPNIWLVWCNRRKKNLMIRLNHDLLSLVFAGLRVSR